MHYIADWATPWKREGSHYGVVTNVLYCNIVLSEFEFQSRYYVLFRSNTPEENMNFLTYQLLVK